MENQEINDNLTKTIEEIYNWHEELIKVLDSYKNMTRNVIAENSNFDDVIETFGYVDKSAYKKALIEAAEGLESLKNFNREIANRVNKYLTSDFKEYDSLNKYFRSANSLTLLTSVIFQKITRRNLSNYLYEGLSEFEKDLSTNKQISIMSDVYNLIGSIKYDDFEYTIRKNRDLAV